MADPRLNSIHLEPLRRQDFRQARKALLDARGDETRCLEYKDLADLPAADPQALRPARPASLPAGTEFVLMDKQAAYPLKVGLNTVGRMPDNDVVIDDPYVSRRHCAILVHSGHKCELHDVASKNGTFLNGRKLTGPAALVVGDELRLCERQFILLSGSDCPPPQDVTQTH